MSTRNSNAGAMVQRPARSGNFSTRGLFSRLRIALLSAFTLVLQIAPPIPAIAQA
jgi:hypothetical protein